MISRRFAKRVSASAVLSSLLFVTAWTVLQAAPDEKAGAPAGWTTAAQRDEIKPLFSWDPAGGPNHKGSLQIRSDEREGLHGRWTREFQIEGGKHYRFF